MRGVTTLLCLSDDASDDQGFDLYMQKACPPAKMLSVTILVDCIACVTVVCSHVMKALSQMQIDELLEP